MAWRSGLFNRDRLHRVQLSFVSNVLRRQRRVRKVPGRCQSLGGGRACLSSFSARSRGCRVAWVGWLPGPHLRSDGRLNLPATIGPDRSGTNVVAHGDQGSLGTTHACGRTDFRLMTAPSPE